MQTEQSHGHGLNAGRENAVNGAHSSGRGLLMTMRGKGEQTQTENRW
jgi:hypothetical protein